MAHARWSGPKPDHRFHNRGGLVKTYRITETRAMWVTYTSYLKAADEEDAENGWSGGNATPSTIEIGCSVTADDLRTDNLLVSRVDLEEVSALA